MFAALSLKRAWRGRAIVAVATAWCAAAPVASAGARPAGGAPTEGGEPQQRAVLDLVVNQGGAGQVLALIRRSDILVPADALEQAGLRQIGGRREVVGTQTFVSLASLAPAIVYTLDEQALVLQLTARAEALGVHRLDFATGRRPPYTFSRATSAFVNYGLDWRQGSGPGGTAEIGFSAKGVLASTTGSWLDGGRFAPGLSSITIDDRSRLRRIVVGDSFAGDRLLGSTLLLGGVRVAREYAVDPYFVQYPLLGMSGAADTPSLLEVYVDGRLVRQERVPAGRFELSNLPVPAGSSRTRVVIRDAFGREQEMRAPYYLSSSVLAPGLHEYEYAAGFPRVSTESGGVDYQSPVAIARHRYGFTHDVTAGARVEAGPGVVNGGPSLNLQTPVGEIEVAGALSGGQAGTGGALAVGYAWLGSPVSLGVSARTVSGAYRTISSASLERRSRYEVNAHAGVRLGGLGSLSVSHVAGDAFDAPSQSRTSVFAHTRLGRRSTLFLGVGRTRTGRESNTELSLGVTVALGQETTATLSGAAAPGQTTTSLELQRSLPPGSGYGYRLRTGLAGDRFGGGRFEYQSSHGRYEIGQEVRGTANATSISVSGGVVALGGAVLATRPVQSGFALVRVPGVEGVRAFLSNHVVGRTNARGEVLIPNLLPYYANRLSIADEDLPVGHELRVREQQVAPPYRGGAIVTFPAGQVKAATGTVTITRESGEPTVPVYGDLVVVTPGGLLESPVGRGGRYYLEPIEPGRYQATVRYLGTSCTFTLLVPGSKATVINAGASSCRLEAKAP